MIFTKWKESNGAYSIVLSQEKNGLIDFFEFDLFKFDDSIKIVDFLKYSVGFKDSDFNAYFFKNNYKSNTKSIENFRYTMDYNNKGIIELNKKNDEKAAEYFKWVDQNYGDEFIVLRRRIMNINIFSEGKQQQILEQYINRYGQVSKVGAYHKIWLNKIKSEKINESLKVELIDLVGESEMLNNYLN